MITRLAMVATTCVTPPCTSFTQQEGANETVFVLSGTTPADAGGDAKPNDIHFYGFMFIEASTTATLNSVFQVHIVVGSSRTKYEDIHL